MISRHHLWLLPVGFLNLALPGCAPAISNLDVSQDTVVHLPREVALNFLMSLNATKILPCRFGPEGVESERSGGRPAAYSSLTVEPEIMGSGSLRVNGQTSEIFCFFGGPAVADKQQLEQKLFFKKALTALLALGVQPPSSATQSIKSEGTSLTIPPKRQYRSW